MFLNFSVKLAVEMGQNINQNIRNQISAKELLDYDHVLQGVKKNDLVSLSKALTLIENKNLQFSSELLNFLSKLKVDQRTLRIGISGPPGVGKSTFIEAIGLKLIEQGYKVAVLAVDPSSEINKGSILGDKTRMDKLSREKNAFIRPSSNALESGGVRSSTFDAIKICEAAGFEIILVETVGVGQSEVDVAKVTDLMILLLPPAGGDELQGIKKGILEMAEIILINKADSGLEVFAGKALKDYKIALHLSRRKEGILEQLIIRKISALTGSGIVETSSELLEVMTDENLYNKISKKRLEQEKTWLRIKSQAMLLHLISNNRAFQQSIEEVKDESDIYKALIKIGESFEKKFK